MNINFNWKGINLDVQARYYPGLPAKTNALPENCYPEEYPEIEIKSIFANGVSADWLLDSEFLEEIEITAIENIEEEQDCEH
jgi:hypothetical protein